MQYQKQSEKLFICVLCVLFLLCGCQAAKGGTGETYTSFSQLEDKKLGVMTGSVQEKQARQRFPDAEFYYFSSSADVLTALKAGKIDAYADAEPLTRYMMAYNPELTYIRDEMLAEGMKVGAIFPKTEKGRILCDEFSEFVRNIKNSGEYDEIQDIWFGEDESKRVIPDPESLPGGKGVLRIAADPTAVPFVYIKEGNTVGLDVDLVFRFCREYGYGLEIILMDFSSILPAVSTGKCDFANNGIAYTPERAESVYYSEFTMETGSVMAVLKGGGAGSEGFLESLCSSFEKTFLREDRWRLFAEGAWNTVLITVFSIVFGTLLGFAVYLLCRSGNIIANKVTDFMIWLIQGMPMVVLLMVLYYIIFGSSGISGLAVAVIAFSLTFAVSVYGMLSAGEKAVDKGQMEAAAALGYDEGKAFFRIILPQAAIHFMPSFRAQVVSLLKATAVVGYVTVQDLTKMGDIVRSRTYEAFFPLIAVTVIYFILSWILTSVIDFLTRKTDPRKRKPQEILKGVKTHD